jgi:hypothetical protein
MAHAIPAWLLKRIDALALPLSPNWVDEEAAKIHLNDLKSAMYILILVDGDML